MKQEKAGAQPIKGWRRLLEILIGLALLEGLFFLFRLGATWFSPPPT